MLRKDMDTECRSGPAKRAALALLAAVALTIAGSAEEADAQGMCMPRDKLVKMLDSRFDEAPVARGLDSGGRLVEVFSSADGATWTLLLTAPDGISCLMAEGKGWNPLPAPMIGQVS